MIKIIKQQNNLIKNLTDIFISIFLVYFSINSFLHRANERTLNNMFILIIILLIVCYFLSKLLFVLLDKIKIIIINRFNNEGIEKDYSSVTLWFFPSIVFALGSIILFIIFLKYIRLELSIFGNIENDYRLIALNINNVFFPIIISVGLILGLFMELYNLIKIRRINVIISILSLILSLLSIIFIFIFFKIIFSSIVR